MKPITIRKARLIHRRYYYVAINGTIRHEYPDKIILEDCQAGPFRRHTDLMFWRVLQTAKSHLEDMCDLEDKRLVEDAQRQAEIDAEFDDDERGEK